MLRNRYSRKESAMTLYRGDSGSMSKFTKLYNTNSCRPNLIPIPPTTPPRNKPLLNDGAVPLSECNTPVSDVNIPTTLVNMRSFLEIPTKFVAEILPDLPPVFSSKFHHIFEKKVKLCRQKCAFVDLAKEEIAIKMKSAALNEILMIFSGSASPTNSMEDEEIELLFEMLKKNIIRRLPMVDPKALVLDDLPPLYDPSWPHLSTCYQILCRLAIYCPFFSFFEIGFFKKMITIFDTTDPNERNAIIQFFNNLLRENYDLAIPLLAEFEKVLNDHNNQTNPAPFCVATILPIIRIIIDLSTGTLPIFNRVFVRTIVPLLGDSYMLSFQGQIENFIDIFLDDNTKYAVFVVNQLTKKWPKVKAAKQLFFINLLNYTLPKMGPRDIAASIKSYVNTIALGVSSLHEKVVLASLGTFSKIELDRVVSEHNKIILPVIVPLLITVISKHWSPQARTSARLTLNILQKFDARFIQEYMSGSGAAKALTNNDSSDQKKWVSIVRSAQHNDNSINVNHALYEISLVYTKPLLADQQEKGELVPVGRQVHRARSNSNRASCPLPKLNMC